MTSITAAIVTQASDLQSRTLPMTGAAPASLRPLGGLLAHVRLLGSLLSALHLLRSEDRPGAAVLRDLGLDHEPRRKTFPFAGIHHGLDTSRARFLDTSQGWRGS